MSEKPNEKQLQRLLRNKIDFAVVEMQHARHNTSRIGKQFLVKAGVFGEGEQVNTRSSPEPYNRVHHAIPLMPHDQSPASFSNHPYDHHGVAGYEVFAAPDHTAFRLALIILPAEPSVGLLYASRLARMASAFVEALPELDIFGLSFTFNHILGPPGLTNLVQNLPPGAHPVFVSFQLSDKDWNSQYNYKMVTLYADRGPAAVLMARHEFHGGSPDRQRPLSRDELMRAFDDYKRVFNMTMQAISQTKLNEAYN